MLWHKQRQCSEIERNAGIQIKVPTTESKSKNAEFATNKNVMIGLLWQHRWVSTKQKGPHRAVWTTPSARLLTELPKVAHPPNLVQYYHQEIWRLKWSENLYPLLWKKKRKYCTKLVGKNPNHERYWEECGHQNGHLLRTEWKGCDTLRYLIL